MLSAPPVSCCAHCRELAEYKQSTDNMTSADQARVSTKSYDNPAILDLVLEDPAVADNLRERERLQARVTALRNAVSVLKSIA